jgi:methyl-accepting chemotaxis protein PixJ
MLTDNASPSITAKPAANNWFKSLRAKAVGFALAIGVLPVIIGASAVYWFVAGELERNVLDGQKQQAVLAMDKLEDFLFERYGDIQVIASLLSTLRSRNVPLAQQQATLEEYSRTYGVYDAIAVTDINGIVIRKVGQLDNNNFRNAPYWQEAVRNNRRVFAQPTISPNSKEPEVFLASPIVVNGEVTGAVILRVSKSKLTELLKDFAGTDNEYFVTNQDGLIFLSNEQELIGRQAKEELKEFPELQQRKETFSNAAVHQREGAVVQGFSPWSPRSDLELPELRWAMVTTTPQSSAFAALNQLRTAFIIGTFFLTGALFLLTLYVANRAIQPILSATNAVQKIGAGDLSVRLPVEGEDELAVLGNNINQLAEELDELITAQKQENERLEQARQEARAEAEARAREQQRERENLQRRALELLMEVDPVSRGDLTVKAKVTEDEIGTLADSYNSLIRSLRQIVAEVQTAAQAVNQTAIAKESAVSAVAENTNQQAQAVTSALQQIEAIAQSLQGVALRAIEAEKQVEETNKVVRDGDNAMERTVESISAIRETVAETAKKVKRLGEASQKISKVVNLISDFADQTNLLALNAAIEAARAGEEGRGFAVVAEEVRVLAQQSATATAEIEELVQEIQSQTNQVVSAMEAGTDQVVMGTQLVEESKQKLSQIAAASAQVNRLVQEIAQSAAAQTQTSEMVSKTMQSVAKTVQDTSVESIEVAESFKELLSVAQQLQVSVSQFKL